MQTFDCLNDIEDWLEPLSYEAFWEAIKPHCVPLQPKSEFDKLIDDGVFTPDQVMLMVKRTVVLEISERYNLSWKDRSPYLYG